MNPTIASRKERWLRERWPAIRARGMARFVLVRGLATWGGLMAVATSAMIIQRLGIDHPRMPLLLVIAVTLSAVGGLFWGALSWWINERLFQSLTSD